MASTASRLYKEARKAERDGAVAQAYILYSEASAADPRNAKYRQRAEALRVQATIQAQLKPPVAEKSAAAVGDSDLAPENIFDNLTDRDLASAQEALPPAELQLPPGRGDYDLQGDYRALWQQGASRLGIQVIFDGDYQPGRRLKFRLDDQSARDVLHGLEAATDSFLVPLNPKLMIVAQDTENKRRDLEQVEALTVPVPHALTAQELTEIGQILKQTVSIDKVFWNSAHNVIVIRDRVTRARAAEAILHQLIAYKAQVAIDLEFIELSEADLLDVGVDVNLSMPIVYLGKILNGTGTTPSGVNGLMTFGGGRSMFGVGVVEASVIANMNSSKARSLLHTTVVSVEGQKATFHSGDKYPILTGGFFGSGNTNQSSQAFLPTPSFTFEDLGIVVNVTPQVHDDQEVSLELDTEYKVLGTGQFNGIPVISNRKLQSTLRLRNNQWALVAGLTTQTRNTSFTGPALLTKIPLLKSLISRFTRDRARTYVVLAMKPRLLSLPPDQTVTHDVYLGSETKPVTRL